MEFKKITISIPKNMYSESMELVKKGLFSNFSDIVRSGIREEIKELHPIIEDFDEKFIYRDTKLIEGVKQSMKEAKKRKGRTLKDEKEMDEYFNSL